MSLEETYIKFLLKVLLIDFSFREGASYVSVIPKRLSLSSRPRRDSQGGSLEMKVLLRMPPLKSR